MELKRKVQAMKVHGIFRLFFCVTVSAAGMLPVPDHPRIIWQNGTGEIHQMISRNERFRQLQRIILNQADAMIPLSRSRKAMKSGWSPYRPRRSPSRRGQYAFSLRSKALLSLGIRFFIIISIRCLKIDDCPGYCFLSFPRRRE